MVNNFGIKETYFQLYHKALSLRNNNNVSEYFCKLKNILAKLNEKYEYDSQKPTEFSPKANESLILKTFLDNIDSSLASVVLSRNLNTLREAYNILQISGLIREKQKQNFNQNQQNVNSNNRTSNNLNKHINSNQHNNQYRNSHHSNNSGQFKNSSQSSGQRWPSTNHNSQRHYPNNSNQFRNHPSGLNSFQSRQNRDLNSSAQLRRNQVEPMDVDHIEHEVNFQLSPQKRIYR